MNDKVKMSKEFHDSQIREYIINKSNRIFSNSNKELYKLLLKNIFLYTSSIKWLMPNADRLKDLFKDQDVLASFNKFIKSKNIEIILADKKTNQIVQNLKNIKNENFKFKQNSELSNSQDILIWDNIGYRFSPDLHKLTGCACANDPEFVEKCSKIIEKF